MKTKHQFWIMVALVGLILQACTTVYFREPQPEGTKNLKSFPNKLIGVYALHPEKEKVIIADDTVILEEFIINYISRRELDSLVSRGQLSQRGDSLFITDPESEEVMPFAVKDLGDSLRLDQMEQSIITLSDTSVLRSKKGSFYLSLYEEDKELWEVMRIDLLRGDRLLVRTIGEEGVGVAAGYMDLDTLGDRGYSAQPSAKEFLEFSKQEGFSDTLFFLPKLR